MNKNNSPIYLAIAVVFGILIGTFFSGGNTTLIGENSANERKIKRLIDYIQNDYVDTINTDELLDGAIAKMLEKLATKKSFTIFPISVGTNLFLSEPVFSVNN